MAVQAPPAISEIEKSNEAVVLPKAASAPAVRISSIDGLRALAMFMVFSFHVWEFGDSPALNIHAGGATLSFGHLLGSFPAGVDLFMVLSGFCLFWPLVKSPQRLKDWSPVDYLKRRFRRIAPPYYAAILFVTLLPNVLVLLYHLAGKQAKWQSVPSLWDYATHFLFIHTLFLNTWDKIQGAFWSLGLEMQFYLVFPLVIYCYRKYGIRVVAGMTVISIIYRILAGILTDGAPGDLPFLVTIFFLGRWMQFAAGMLAASIVARHVNQGKMISASTGWLMLLGAVALYFTAIAQFTGHRPWSMFPLRDLLFAAAYGGVIVALCASSTQARWLFENRLVTWLGFISYSVFLIHQNTAYYVGEFFKKVRPESGPVRFLILETVGFVLVVAVSAVFFKFFEKPFLSGPKRSQTPERRPDEPSPAP